MRDNQTGRLKGFGFVRYSSQEEAQKAVKAMDGRVCTLLAYYLGCNLQTSFAGDDTLIIL